MRAAVIAAIVAVPLSAAAGPYHAVTGSPFSDVIMQPPKRLPAGQQAFTSVSHTIYLNPCLPDGCTLRPGGDDSRTDTSSIPQTQAVLTAFPHGQAKWDALVQCVTDLYAPFDIQITDVDPGNANHFEVMIAGTGAAIGVDGAGGVAPFEPCDGQLQDNVISFVFAAQTSSLDFMCWAAAQESAHVFGLDHLLSAKDPMTYLTPPIKKEGFQNVDAKCGEELGQPRECWCGGTTQNSYQYLMDVFGPSQLEPATMTITEPADGAWVKPGFNVRVAVMSQLSVMTGELQVDGTTTQTIKQGDPLVWSAPSNLPGGDHTIAVVATDSAMRTFSSQIAVHVTARCSEGTACTGDFKCLGGYCLPGASVAGGLGAPCTGNEECITGTCGSDGASSLCTGACDEGFACPSGFACADAGSGQTVCWPGADDGGCSTSAGSARTKKGPSPWLALFGLGALAMIVRRRR